MKKLGITEKDLIESEDESDKRLEKRAEAVKKQSESTARQGSRRTTKPSRKR